MEPMASYDFTTHLTAITHWYTTILATYPAGPDREAKKLLLVYRDRFAQRAAEDPAPEAGVAATQWNRMMLILAEAEREAGRPGWQPEWTGVYEHYIDGDDMLHGPFGPQAGGPAT